MAIIPVTLGETARLALVLENGDATQFPQVNIYQPANGTPIATLDLDHTAEGMYEPATGYTPAAVGVLNAVYTIYSDAARTIPNTDFSKELDQILTTQVDDNTAVLNELVEKIVRLLGLNHENAFIDNTEYDEYCQLISSRLRIFDTAAHTNLATDGGTETDGLIATYQVSVEYEGPAKMRSYRMVKL